MSPRAQPGSPRPSSSDAGLLAAVHRYTVPVLRGPLGDTVSVCVPQGPSWAVCCCSSRSLRDRWSGDPVAVAERAAGAGRGVGDRGARAAGACVRPVRPRGDTPAPAAPTTRLVVNGFHRYARNPMYVAVVVMMVGQASWITSCRGDAPGATHTWSNAPSPSTPPTRPAVGYEHPARQQPPRSRSSTTTLDTTGPRPNYTALGLAQGDDGAVGLP